jgi:hypothetical protein
MMFRTATRCTKYDFNFFFSIKTFIEKLYLYIIMKIIFQDKYIDTIFTFPNPRT